MYINFKIREKFNRHSYLKRIRPIWFNANTLLVIYGIFKIFTIHIRFNNNKIKKIT